MFHEILLDCRELEAPEPLNLITKNISNIDENTYLKIIHRMEPILLYGILNQNGFEYIPKLQKNQVIIYIFNNSKIKEYLSCL